MAKLVSHDAVMECMHLETTLAKNLALRALPAITTTERLEALEKRKAEIRTEIFTEAKEYLSDLFIDGPPEICSSHNGMVQNAIDVVDAITKAGGDEADKPAVPGGAV